MCSFPCNSVVQCCSVVCSAVQCGASNIQRTLCTMCTGVATCSNNPLQLFPQDFLWCAAHLWSHHTTVCSVKCSIQCASWCVQSTVCIVICVVYRLQCQVKSSVQWAVCRVQCAMCSLQRQICIVQCEVCSGSGTILTATLKFQINISSIFPPVMRLAWDWKECLANSTLSVCRSFNIVNH